MKTRLTLAGAALLAFAGIANAATTPTQPVSDTYLMTIYDLSQSGAGCGGNSSGGTSPGTLHYPGPGATGTVLTQAKNDDLNYGFTVVSFPQAPAAGVKSWSGSLSAVEQPSGKSISATFKGTFTFIDPHHFLLLLKVTQGGCVQTKQIAAYSSMAGLGAAAIQRP